MYGCSRGGYDDWKVSFKTTNENLLAGKVKESNVPLVVNLRQGPFERYPVEGGGYARWWGDKAANSGVSLMNAQAR